MAEGSQLGIRTSEDIKNLFNDLSDQDGFKNNGDFLSHLITMYQAERTKEEESIVAPAIEAAQTFINLLMEILVGVGAEAKLKNEKHQHDLVEQRDSFENTRELLQQRIDLLAQSLAESEERAAALISERDDAVNKAADITGRMTQMDRTISDKDLIIKNEQEKNNDLKKTISENEGYAQENKELKDLLNKSESENSDLRKKIDELNNEIIRTKNDFEKEMEHLKNALSVEKDAALNMQQSEFHEKLNDLRDKHAKGIEEQQAKHSASISEHESRVKELLNQITLFASSVKTPPASKAKAQPKDTPAAAAPKS